MEVNGKVAVVTGAASGMGFAMAETFAGAGMKIVLADIEEAGPHINVSTLADTAVLAIAKNTIARFL